MDRRCGKTTAPTNPGFVSDLRALLGEKEGPEGQEIECGARYGRGFGRRKQLQEEIGGSTSARGRQWSLEGFFLSKHTFSIVRMDPVNTLVPNLGPVPQHRLTDNLCVCV